jgi:hypothetical protein
MGPVFAFDQNDSNNGRDNRSQYYEREQIILQAKPGQQYQKQAVFPFSLGPFLNVCFKKQ